MKKGLLICTIILLSTASFAQTKKEAAMHLFVKNLIAKMTLAEKLGQLNLPAASDFVTGQVSSSDIAEKVKAGKVGGVFNIRSVTKIKELQQFAVNNTRLHIPLLFGMDVIHGYKTIFPIPIGMSSTWDLPLIERSARIAANEASADGIMWTFSPMVDLTRDPRWGRVSEGNGEDAFLSSAITKAMVHGYQGEGAGGDQLGLTIGCQRRHGHDHALGTHHEIHRAADAERFAAGHHPVGDVTGL